MDTLTLDQSADDPVDFDITTATVNPVYALADTLEAPFELVLRNGNTIYPLAFCNLPDALIFQQSLTGYEVADGYCQYVSSL